MSRNSAGTYTLPPPNPVVPFTVITAAWANTTMNDIAQALTDSLDRTGRGGMLAPFKVSDGTQGLPGFAFTNEVSVGLYRPTAGMMTAVASGQDVLAISKDLVGVSGNLNFVGTARRITADLTNATIANRLAFQNSAANSNSPVMVAPTGTGTVAQWMALTSSDINNASWIAIQGIGAGSPTVSLTAGAFGSGSYLPLIVNTNNTERLRVDINGNVGIGTAGPLASWPAWTGGRGPALQIGPTGAISSPGANGVEFDSSNGMYFDGTNWRNINATFVPTLYAQVNSGQHLWYTGGAAGAAGALTNLVEAMRIDASGRLITKFGPVLDNMLVVNASNGGSTVMPAGCPGIVFNHQPSGIASYTVTVPPNPVNGQVIRFTTLNDITTLNFILGGNSLVGGVISLTQANSPRGWIFIGSGGVGTWYKM